MQELDKLWNTSDSVVNTVGEVNTPEKFSIYHKCAKDLLDNRSESGFIPMAWKISVNVFKNPVKPLQEAFAGSGIFRE